MSPTTLSQTTTKFRTHVPVGHQDDFWGVPESIQGQLSSVCVFNEAIHEQHGYILNSVGGYCLLSAIFGAIWCDLVWYVMVWHGMVWCGVVCYGVVWYGMVWCGVVWCGIVWYGMVWCGVVCYGVVWYGMVWCGVVWYGVA